MTAKDVDAYHPEFSKYNYKSFHTSLNNLRKSKANKDPTVFDGCPAINSNEENGKFGNNFKGFFTILIVLLHSR